MDSHYWSAEFWRIALFIFIAIVAGSITNHWLACFTISSIIYSAWLLYKINKLNQWLKDKDYSDNSSESTGIWERIETRIRDIYKSSQKNKKRTTKLLKRFQGIVQGLPYATVILNSNNEIDWANEKAKNYLNIDIVTDRGQRIDNILRSPDAVKLVNNKNTKEIETSLPHNSERLLAIQFVPVQKDLKMVLARDISDRINVQQMRKNFISNASHELRTPLTVIAGYLEMMTDDESLPDHLKPAIESSSIQSARMKSIIDDMLTLSRLEKSELDEDSCIRVDVPSILKSICNDEIKITSTDGHKIKTEISDDLCLTGVETEIISVCSNLIQNAIKHTPPGTDITVSWKKHDDGDALLIVEDNGPGIPQEHLSYLTQRFYRVDKGRSRDKGGTGLGLAIVQHIIQRHGGQLKISSQINKGSSFSAKFPQEKVG